MANLLELEHVDEHDSHVCADHRIPARTTAGAVSTASSVHTTFHANESATWLPHAADSRHSGVTRENPFAAASSFNPLHGGAPALPSPPRAATRGMPCPLAADIEEAARELSLAGFSLPESLDAMTPLPPPMQQRK